LIRPSLIGRSSFLAKMGFFLDNDSRLFLISPNLTISFIFRRLRRVVGNDGSDKYLSEQLLAGS
jgi:hypothetical protein